MNKFSAVIFGTLASSLFASNVFAEPYVGLSLGWTFNQKLSSVHGNENLAYPNPSGGVFDGDPTSGNLLFPGTTYTDVKLKDVLQGGLKAGYYFESAPSFGIELEGNYSQPNIFRQNVTLTNPNFVNNDTFGNLPLTQDGAYTTNGTHFTEDQQSAKVQLLQFSLNGLYRYQGFEKFTPYIGGGPSLNILRITGTGVSGVIVDPLILPTSLTSDPSAASIHQTSVNVGVNFKVGAEYKFDQEWGLAGEYHYNWSPIAVDNFRSVSNLKADYEAHTLNVVLMRHF